MKILFMGTPDFALFSLRTLYDHKREVVGVVTQPDKPRGRGYKLLPSPIKQYALDHAIPVYQPTTLRDAAFAQVLQELQPELIVVIAYGKLLPQSVLDYPQYGCINVHGSLLPNYRGAAPIQRAIMAGETTVGVTTMYLAAGLDTGDMLEKSAISVLETDNFETIHDRLAEVGAKTLLTTIEKIENGTIQRTVQDDTQSTYAAKIENADCLVDFNKSAVEIHNQIRGLSPLPLAYATLNGEKTIKLIVSIVLEKETIAPVPAGTVLALDAVHGIFSVACGKGILGIAAVLPEGKSRMSAAAFIRGRNIKIGDIF